MIVIFCAMRSHSIIHISQTNKYNTVDSPHKYPCFRESVDKMSE